VVMLGRREQHLRIIDQSMDQPVFTLGKLLHRGGGLINGSLGFVEMFGTLKSKRN
jgi:hypothetical protein